MMNLPWIAAALAAIVVFAVLEAYAFKYPTRMNTLSRSVATLGAKWPFSIFLAGLFAGVLAGHFWWSWATNPIGAGLG